MTPRLRSRKWAKLRRDRAALQLEAGESAMLRPGAGNLEVPNFC